MNALAGSLVKLLTASLTSSVENSDSSARPPGINIFETSALLAFATRHHPRIVLIPIGILFVLLSNVRVETSLLRPLVSGWLFQSLIHLFCFPCSDFRCRVACFVGSDKPNKYS